MTAKLMPHQQEALGKMKNGCILKGSTGTGKTAVALAYYDDVQDVERLIVITTAKKRDTGDWEAEARLFGIFPEVNSWQNLGKYENVSGAFFIFDEQRVVGSGQWVNSFLKITKRNSWVLLTATPGDTWMDYIPVFIANGFYRTRTEFLREHVVFAPYVRYPKVQRFTATAKLARLLGSILVEMPFEKKTIRHEIDLFAEYDKEAYDVAWRRRWNAEEGRPIRQVSELFAIMRRVVNGDASRLQRVEEILYKHAKIVVFYNFDYELEGLRELCKKIQNQVPEETEGIGENSGSSTVTVEGTGSTLLTLKTRESFAVAEWNGHKHEAIPEAESWIYLVQYAAGSEGWNCFETDTMVFYSLTYSYRMFEQAKGRIDRIGTPFTDLYYYVIRSSSGIDFGIMKALETKRNFNQDRFMKTAI